MKPTIGVASAAPIIFISPFFPTVRMHRIQQSLNRRTTMQKPEKSVTLIYAKSENAKYLIQQAFIRYVNSKLACRKN